MRRGRLLALVLCLGCMLQAADTNLNRTPRPRASKASAAGSVCSANLKDGRSFLSGSAPEAAPQPWAAYFDSDGKITSAAQPLLPRTSHICIAIDKDLVLIAGGSSGIGGPTSSAELFQPSANTWATTGSMRTARTGAAAILLRDGKVLVAGGETSGSIANSLEIFDPADRTFRLAAGVLSSPRAHHAIAALADGRVLLAGGTDGQQELDSIDIFDPATEAVRPAGFMSTRRSDFTATELAGGRILLAGGTNAAGDLASAEIFDPVTGLSEALPSMAAARRSHVAIRPAGSDNVLIASGSCGSAECETAEIFDATANRFIPAAEPHSAEPKTIRVTVASIESGGKPRRVKAWAVRSR